MHSFIQNKTQKYLAVQIGPVLPNRFQFGPLPINLFGFLCFLFTKGKEKKKKASGVLASSFLRVMHSVK